MMTTEESTRIKEDTKAEDTENPQSKEFKDQKEVRKIADNILLVGKKPLSTYIKSIIVLFKKKNLPEIVIRSRGKFISRAVDIAEVSKRNLHEDKVYIKEIKTSSEVFEQDGKRTTVSSIDIILSKK